MLRRKMVGRVLVWRHEAESLEPVARHECQWSFTDAGPYKTLRVPDVVGVGSCRVADTVPPTEAFAWVHTVPGASWQLEIQAPSERLLQSLDAGEAVLQTARWDAGP